MLIADHIGDQKAAGINAGTCGRPETVSAAPNSNTVEIAAAKNAALIVSSSPWRLPGTENPEHPGRADAQLSCGRSRTRNDRSSIGSLRRESPAWRQEKPSSEPAQTTAVQIALVPAHHSNFALPSLLTGSAKAGLAADGLPAYVGDANGYVLVFTNGLRVYLSGDTAIYGDMKNIIKDFYRVNLAVMNVGAFSMQGEEAAFAVDELVQPAAVIVSHVDEAATENGVVRAGTKTKQFIELVKKSRVHVPRSGHTMEFTGDAKCVSGC